MLGEGNHVKFIIIADGNKKVEVEGIVIEANNDRKQYLVTHMRVPFIIPKRQVFFKKEIAEVIINNHLPFDKRKWEKKIAMLSLLDEVIVWENYQSKRRYRGAIKNEDGSISAAFSHKKQKEELLSFLKRLLLSSNKEAISIEAVLEGRAKYLAKIKIISTAEVNKKTRKKVIKKQNLIRKKTGDATNLEFNNPNKISSYNTLLKFRA